MQALFADLGYQRQFLRVASIRLTETLQSSLRLRTHFQEWINGAGYRAAVGVGASRWFESLERQST